MDIDSARPASHYALALERDEARIIQPPDLSLSYRPPVLVFDGEFKQAPGQPEPAVT
ncbi:MAG: hypothetical protein ACREQW_10580 [Candidatus Binatia bacterium]